MRGSATHVLAACFALCAFAVAVIAGLASGNEALTILLRAVASLVICYPVGMLVGSVCERVLERHIDQYRAEHPADGRAAPDQSTPSASSTPVSNDVRVSESRPV